MNFDAYLFDLDGTLIDHRASAVAAITQGSEELGVTPAPKQWFTFQQRWSEAFERGEIDHQEHRRGCMRDYLNAEETGPDATGDTFSDEELDAAYQRFLELDIENAVPFEDSLDLLQRLLDSGAKVAILTNGVTDIQSAKLKAAGLDLPGIEIFTIDRVRTMKPNPAFYSRALAELGVAPAKAIMLGDNYRNDVFSATAAGIPALFVNRPAGDTLADFPPAQPQLVVADMDGTLLDADGNLPNTFAELHQQLTDNDVLFVPASGRQYSTLARMFPNTRTFIAENGNVLVHDGRVIHSTELDKDTVASILDAVGLLNDAADNSAASLVLCAADCAYIDNDDPDFLHEVEKYYATYAIVDDLASVDEPLAKIALYVFDDANDFPLPELEGNVVTAVSGKHWIDFMDPTMNKGIALKKLRERLNIPTARTAVFGDYLNDYELLQEGDLAFAMHNSHPELAKVATWRAPSNTEHGVITVLEAMVRGGAEIGAGDGGGGAGEEASVSEDTGANDEAENDTES